MKNNLKQVKKSLRSFAKRCKNFKYTESALIAFLIAGIIFTPGNLFSATSKDDANIENQKHTISTSMQDIQKTLKKTRIENNKLMKYTTLELIQLMEQGDHVVKNPWSSWQYGINYFNNNWNGTYKGRGDKKAKYPYEGIFTRSNDVFVRNTSPLSNQYKKLPSMGLAQTSYGLISNTREQEPLVSAKAEVAIIPRVVLKNPLNVVTPTMTEPNPTTPNIAIKPPTPIKIVEPIAPNVNPKVPEPNANPFVDYCFTGCGNSNSWVATNARRSAGNVTYYAGVNSSGNFTDAVRPAQVIYINNSGNAGGPGFLYSNDTTGVTLHLAGSSNGHRNVGNASRVAGQIGIHSVADGKLANITANLYSRAAFHSIETWHAGRNSYENVTVNLKGKDNTVFLIYPAAWETLILHNSEIASSTSSFTTARAGAANKRGTFEGNVDVTIPENATKNIIYSALGVQGSFGITSNGNYIIEGQGNMVYSGYGYSPNYGAGLYGEVYDNGTNKVKIGSDYKYTLSGTTTVKPGPSAIDMIPYINLSSYVQSYGDDNIILYFGNKTDIDGDPFIDRSSNANTKINWKKSVVGIYQGEISAKAVIGNQLNIANDGTPQTGGNKTSGDNKYVETNVGVFARSGQRKDITPSADMGALSIFDKDKVHSLQINNVDIKFGKYSKSGIMFASEYGTVMDVAMSTNNKQVITTLSTDIKDNGTVASLGVVGPSGAGKISADDSINEAATGTIIAYSNGVWDNSKHSMSTATEALLKGKPSEINIGANVELSARYLKTGVDGNGNETGINPIAYLAKDGGIVNAKGTTDAKGFGSIIAYAEGYDANNKTTVSKVETTGKITAIDEWVSSDDKTVPYIYKNIGGLAKNKGYIDINGKAEINGIGGLATGDGSVVNLNGANNVIRAGRTGGLAAFDKGVVNVEGITKIEVKDIRYVDSKNVVQTSGSHDSTTPFYANGGGKINFNANTEIEMHNGLIIPDTSDTKFYSQTATPTSSTTKYFNMGNVKYKIVGDKVTFGVFNNKSNVIWNGSTQDLASGLGFNGIITYDSSNPNPFVKTVFENSDITLDTTSTVPGSNNTNAAINLTLTPYTNEGFNSITAERSRITIASTQTINATTALNENIQGLSMGSNKTATSNAETAYINYGTVNNTGGTAAANIAGMNVSYGTITNKSGGNVTVNQGAGIYGTNGSKLVNEAGATITVTDSGAAIAAKVTADNTRLLDYGTDKSGNTQTAIEITNEGNLVTTGMANPIGILAQNNRADEVDRSRVVIYNKNNITLGDRGVGIIVTASSKTAGGNPLHGGTINLTGNGSSDIVTGATGTGVYAQNSNVNLLTNYGIETKEEGAGIYVKGNTSTINGPGKFEYKYNGSATGKGAGLAFGGSLAGESGNPDAKNYVDVDVVNATNTTGGLASLYATGGGTLTNYGTINASLVKGYNIIGDGRSIVNEGVLNVADSTSSSEPNIGIVVTGSGKAVNNKNIIAGDKSVGIYGLDAELGTNSVTTVGKEGIGVYSKGGTVNLLTGSTLNVGTDEGVGVYTVGNAQNVYSSGNINLAENSFGFVNVGNNNMIESNSNVNLYNNNIYIYSSDTAGRIYNKGNVTASGNRNYGVYAAGHSENSGHINMGTGLGNIGMYSKSGDAHNIAGGTITVGLSGPNPNYNPIDSRTGNLKDPTKPLDPVGTLYSVGMAAGYLERDPRTNLLVKDSAGNNIVHDQGRITNSGTINVVGKDSTGMYGAGSNTVITNDTNGYINLASDGAIGIFAEEGARVINRGTIQTTVDGLKDVKGVVLGKDSVLDNQGGKILIKNADTSVGVLLKGATIINRGTIEVRGGIGSTETQVFEQSSTGKPVSAFPNIISISAEPNAPEATITVNGQVVRPEPVKFNVISAPKQVSISSIGIYVDTSGTEYTIPVIGLQNLTKEADLIIGSEAARRTTAKEIVIDDPNIIDPYNESMRSNGRVDKWNFYSGALTWTATATIIDASMSAFPGHVQINKMYLVKKPYTDWAGKDATPVNITDTYNFTNGLEQRYGVEALGSRENKLFQKLNGIGNNEEVLLYQAFDEMMGHQYGNLQQRINATGNLLDKEFNHLKKDWRNPSKQNNKIKVFGMRDEYSTDTAGIIDYTSNSYGVAYVHENEKIKMGNSSGWYAGTVTNRFKFKDIGKSKENQTILKAGIFKTMSPKKDYNGSLQWTIGGNVFVGINDMKRRYLVVDEIFEAKSDYHSYGAALKTGLGYDIRMSERTHLRPYGTLKMEYGKFNNIKEDRGEMRLEIQGNDYFSVKPEVGMEFRYVQPLAVRTNLTVGVTASYENELGKVGNINNKGRVRYTTADWFGIRGEKEDRRGNGKFDLNIGVDNTRFGVTVNGGYDTKGKNVRAGIGFRAIY